MKCVEAVRWIWKPAFVSSKLADAALHARWSLSKAPFASAYRLVRPHTMCGAARLKSLYDAVLAADALGIPGALVECGVARGGSAALMGLASRFAGSNRVVWCFDGFQGMPEPDRGMNPDWAYARRYVGDCRGSVEEVRRLLLGLRVENRIVPGLFQETFKSELPGRVAVLHIDCDWNESVRLCLETFFDRMSPGGIIQFDDYGHWAGARQAVDAFFAARKIAGNLQRVDYSGRTHRKAGEPRGAALTNADGMAHRGEGSES